MNRQDARQALRELGITPTPQLIENWLRANTADDDDIDGGIGDSEPAPVAASEPTVTGDRAVTPHSSRSTLLPRLRESGELVRQPGPRRPGRPRIIGGFFECLADTMKDGTTLKSALAICGVNGLGKSEIRALYRNVAFRSMYQTARLKFLAEHYGQTPTLRARLGRYL